VGTSSDAFSATSTYLTITNGGNVGIGTTTPTTIYGGVFAASGPIFIGGAAATATSTFEGNLRVYGTLQVGSGSTYINESGITFASEGHLRFGNSGIIKLDDSGNFGIGTTTPNWNLQIASSTKTFLTLSDMSTSAAANQRHWFLSSMGGNLYIGTSSDSYATTTMPALFINNSGKMGIGTSSPSNNAVLTLGTMGNGLYVGSSTATSTFEGGVNAKVLNITGTATSTFANGIQLSAGCFQMPSGTCLPTTSGSLPSGSAGQTLSYTSDWTATSTITILASTTPVGLVGIGTTTPNWQLQVAGIRPFLTLTDTSTSSNMHWFLSPQGGNLYIGTTSSALIGTSSISALTININGYLGIGSSSPSQQLSLGGLLYVGGTGTSTIQNGLNVSAVNQTGTASSTLTNGIQLSAGCFQMPSGTCLPTSGGALPGGSAGQILSYTNDWTATSTLTILASTTPVGLVGIGTTTPNWNLQVAGTRPFLTLTDTSVTSANMHWFLSPQGGNFYIGTTSNALTGSSSMSALTINSNGFLGVGTTSPTAELSVAGLLYVGGTGTSTIQNGLNAAALNITGTATSTFANGIQLAAGCFQMPSGTCLPTTSGSLPSGSAGQILSYTNDWNATSTITILASTTPVGLVGIGTTTPNWNLQIAGTRPFLTLSDTSATAGTNSQHWFLSSQGGNLYIGTTTDSYATTTTAALTIKNSGLLGIGTSSPWAKLSVQANNNASIPQFVVASSSATSLVVAPNGYVGIGTANPAAYLEISAPSVATLRLTDTGASGMLSEIAFISGSTYAASITARTDTGPGNNLSFTVGSTYRMSIINNGNVGIGTTTPNWNLQIASSTKTFLTLSDMSAVTANQKHWFLSSMGGNFYVGTSSDSYATGTISALTINSNGYLGIGSSSPSYALSVAGLMYVGGVGTSTIQNGLNAAGLNITGTASSTFANGIQLAAGCFQMPSGTCLPTSGGALPPGSAGQILSYTSDWTATSTITILASTTPVGLVGIGTTTPNWNLQVAGVSPKLTLSDTSVTSNSQHWWLTNTNGDFQIGTTSNSLATSNTLITIASTTGNVGIGMANPVRTLQVNGGISVNSTDQFIWSQKFYAYSNSSDMTIGGPNNYNIVVTPGTNGNTIFSSGLVGIGTTTPAWNLQIASSTKTFLTLSDMGANANFRHWFLSSMGGNFYIGTSSDSYATTTMPALFINNSGKMGIGTSSPSNNAVLTIGTMGNGIYVGSSTATSTFEGGVNAKVLNITGSATSTFANGIQLAAGCFRGADNNCLVNSTSSGSVGASTAIGQVPYYAAVGTTLTATSSIFIATNQNVGIGTTSPYSLLSVQATAGGQTPLFTIASSTAGAATSTYLAVAANGNVSVGSSTPPSSAFFQVGTSSPLLVVDKNSGYVGIGTAGPSYKLDVNAVNTGVRITAGGSINRALVLTGNNTDSTSFTVANTATGGRTFEFLSTSAAAAGLPPSSFVIWDDTGGGTRFVINSGGLVGIGTTTPAWNLQIASSTKTFLTLSDMSTSAAANQRHWFLSSMGGNFYIGTSSDSYATSSISALTINKNGYLGVGTTSPTAELSVGGLLYVGGTGTSTIQNGLNAAALNITGTASSTFANGIQIAAGCFQMPSGTCLPTSGGALPGGSAGQTLSYTNDWVATSTITILASTTPVGLVGIGTTTPNWNLQVAGTRPFLTLTDTSSAGLDAKHWFMSSQGGNLYIGTSSDALTATSTYLTITNSGNVGLGSTSPFAVLSISSLANEASLAIGSSTATSFIIDKFGNVGISSSSPGAQLSITGAAADPYPMLLISTSSPLFATRTVFMIDSNGRAGLGTSAPATAFSLSVDGPIYVAGNNVAGNSTSTFGAGIQTTVLNVTSASATSTFANGIQLSAGCFRNTNGTCAGTGTVNSGTAGQIAWYSSSNTAVSGTSTITILATTTTSYPWGLVGIGTTTPNWNLQVAGTRPFLTLSDTSVTSANMHWFLSPQGGNFYIGTTSNSYTGTSTVPGLTINNNGYVGVGTTSPAAQLSVAGLMYIGGTGTSTIQNGLNVSALNVTGSATSTFANGIQLSAGCFRNTNGTCAGTGTVNSGTAGQIAWYSSSNTAVSGTSTITILATTTTSYPWGLVGIGTTTPNWNLQVAGTRPFLTLTDTSAGLNAKHWFMSSQGGNFYIGSSSDALTATTTFMSIANSGQITLGQASAGNIIFDTTTLTNPVRVGMGTSTPNADLTIVTNNVNQNSYIFTVATTTNGSNATNLRFVVDTDGDILYDGTASTLPDYAEAFGVVGDKANYEPGDVICLSMSEAGKVEKCSQPDQIEIIGVYSTKPGILGILAPDVTDYDINKSDDIPVGLLGRVPVKVNLENGPIALGDKITVSSVAGVGALASSTARIVGRALESFDGSTGPEGKILILLGEGSDSGIASADSSKSSKSKKLDVSGDVTAQGFINISTQEEKKDISYLSEIDYENILGQIASTSVATYSYKTDTGANPERLGLIAEEAPREILSTDGRGVDLYKMASFLWAGVKEQQKQINELADEIVQIKEKIGMTLGTEGEIPAPSEGTAPALQGSALMAAVSDIFNQMGIIFDQGVIKIRSLAVEFLQIRKLAVDVTPEDASAGAPRRDPTIGSGQINPGETAIYIVNNQVATSSKIFITPERPVALGLCLKNQATSTIDGLIQPPGFKVCLNQPAGETIRFDWWIVDTVDNSQQSSDNSGNPPQPPFAKGGESSPAASDGGILPSVSPSVSSEPSPSPEPTDSPSPSPEASPEPTASPSPELSPSPTPSETPTPSASPSPEPTSEPTPEPTPSLTPEFTPSEVEVPSPSASPTPSETPTPSPTPSASPEPSVAPTPEPTLEPTPSEIATP